MACGIGDLNTGKKDPLVDACKKHDEAYIELKETKSPEVRAQVDRKFLEDSLAIARKSKGRVLLVPLAYTYYGLVRAFGWIPWYFKK